jgi:hypothetical protein
MTHRICGPFRLRMKNSRRTHLNIQNVS